MKFFDYLTLAFKNMWRRKSRTFLTIIAITIGSISLILMASIILSIKLSLADQFKQLGAFDLVTVIKDPNSTDGNNSLIGASGGDPSAGKKIDDTTLKAMKRIPGVSEATPVLSNFGISTMKLQGQNKKTWASIIAYDPKNDVFDLSVAYGRKLIATDMDKIVVGSRFVEDMGYSSRPESLLGKHVLLSYRSGGGSAPDWGELPAKPSANGQNQQNDTATFIDIPTEIVGITKSGVLDDGQSYITLGWGKRLATSLRWEMRGNGCNGPGCGPGQQTPTYTLTKDDGFLRDGYSTIILKALDPTDVPEVASAVKALGYGATTAQAMLDQINKILLLVSIVLAIIGGISLFVATIGIINTMVMATYERTREIGVLRACGATRATIRRLFMAEAASLGFWGGIFGLLVSIALTRVAKILVGRYGTSLGSLPIDHIGNFPWWLIISVIAFTTLLGMISGLIPAIKAARLNPVEALRYE